MTTLTTNIAHTTAFLYAGALQAEQEAYKEGALPTRTETYFDDWQGHTGFVSTCTGYAEAIETWLETRQDDNHPGVLAYEIIEPLGSWLIAESTPENRGTDEVLAEFQKRYTEWIKDTDEHGIKPTDRVVAPDGTVIQEGNKPADVERTIETEHYTIELDLHGDHRGYFEHKTLGDERAGGLWYDEKKDLRDYDGVAELPKEVRDALIADGFTSSEGCLDD